MFLTNLLDVILPPKSNVWSKWRLSVALLKRTEREMMKEHDKKNLSSSEFLKFFFKILHFSLFSKSSFIDWKTKIYVIVEKCNLLHRQGRKGSCYWLRKMLLAPGQIWVKPRIKRVVLLKQKMHRFCQVSLFPLSLLTAQVTSPCHRAWNYAQLTTIQNPQYACKSATATTTNDNHHAAATPTWYFYTRGSASIFGWF